MLGKCLERQQTLPIRHANLRRPILVIHESFEVIGANSSLKDGSHQNAFGNVIDVPADGLRVVLPLVIHGSERVAVANYVQKHHDFLNSGHLPRIFQAMCHQALHQRDECFLRHSARMAECVFVSVPEQLAHTHVAGESRSALWSRTILRLGDALGSRCHRGSGEEDGKVDVYVVQRHVHFFQECLWRALAESRLGVPTP